MLDKDQVIHIADLYSIPTNGPMFDRINQIDNYFRQNLPDHPRNEKGALLFSPDIFNCLVNKKTLDELSKNLLVVLMKDY